VADSSFLNKNHVQQKKFGHYVECMIITRRLCRIMWSRKWHNLPPRTVMFMQVPCFFLMPSSLQQIHRFDLVCCWLTVVNVFYCSYFSEAKEHLERWLTCLWDSQCCWFEGPCALKQLKVWHCTFASPKVVKYLASICLLSL
jgi:hypothetical protein